jgi:hypothetical protein
MFRELYNSLLNIILKERDNWDVTHNNISSQHCNFNNFGQLSDCQQQNAEVMKLFKSSEAVGLKVSSVFCLKSEPKNAIT